MRVTEYFLSVMQREDRASIRTEWIEQVVKKPEQAHIQADGRLRLWRRIPEAGDRYLRVILLPDGETVHNAFFDRSFRP